MKKYHLFFPLLLMVFLSGCTFTFGGTLFMITIRDLLLYIVVATVIAVIVALTRPKHKRFTAFWIAFIVGILLTPLASFIYLLILLTRGMKRRDETPPPPKP